MGKHDLAMEAGHWTGNLHR